MAHANWCGKECYECKSRKSSCEAYKQIPCSPDCDNLMGYKINIIGCIRDGCAESIAEMFLGGNFNEVDNETLAEIVEKHGAIAVYPYL